MPPLGVLRALDGTRRGEERLAFFLGEVDDGELLGGVLPQGGRERLVELGLAAGEEGRDEGDEVGVDVVDCVSRNVSAGVRGALERTGEGQLGGRGDARSPGGDWSRNDLAVARAASMSDMALSWLAKGVRWSGREEGRGKGEGGER